MANTCLFASRPGSVARLLPLSLSPSLHHGSRTRAAARLRVYSLRHLQDQLDQGSLPGRPPGTSPHLSAWSRNSSSASQDVKRHLSLLGAFHNLRRTVENGCEGFAAHLGSEARWSVFCTIAVRRFELYLETAAPGKSELPPLDCLLVWHAYLLNTRYARRHPASPARQLIFGSPAGTATIAKETFPSGVL